MTAGVDRQAAIDRLRPYVQRARQLKGFTLEFEPSPLGSPVPWDYARRARELLLSVGSVLDMCTGGGEVFSSILEGLEVLAVATEPWLPNVWVAAERLRRVGARVVHADSLAIPFRDQAFDLVLNRHEELDPAETARVLAPGGTVLTQQVHPDSWREFRAYFPRMTYFGPHFVRYQEGFRAAGLEVKRAQIHETPAAFRNLGEVAYMLTALPCEVPAFDIERDLDALLALENGLRRPEGIVVTEGRYLIEARKPR